MSGYYRLPDHEASQLRLPRRVRWWLIKRLARGDLLVINSRMTIPHGWRLLFRDMGQFALVTDNRLELQAVNVVPGELVLERRPT